MWGGGNSHSLLPRMQNGMTTLEDGWQLKKRKKTKDSFTIRSSNYVPRYLPKWAENLHLYKNPHIKVYSGFIYIFAQTCKQPRCPSGSEQIHSVKTMEYYLALKRNELARRKMMWGRFKCILLSERRLRTAWFQQGNILEEAKLGDV